MLGAVSCPEDQAISIDSVVPIIDGDLEDYFVLEQHEDAIVLCDDLEGFQALVDYGSGQSEVGLYSTIYDSYLSAVVIRPQ